ncbi:MAG: hypothetical protein E2O91_02260 [Alphaproteobacteria bacterium]|nr:MAG: hypothetical protein E2O91_02260 [Alphaproteobacteria bacterium]
MILKDFPKLSGPPPWLWGLGMLSVSALLLFLLPTGEMFLGLNILSVGLILGVVIKAGPWLQTVDRNFLLVSALVILVTLFGLYRGFDKLDNDYAFLTLLFPAVIFYYARRIYAIRYSWATAIDYAATLGLEGAMEFAGKCRSEYGKELAALMIAAEVYRTVAEDCLKRGAEVRPVHILAMQNYAHMLLYGEAKGVMGEGEWFAKKAHELSKKLLAGPVGEATMH